MSGIMSEPVRPVPFEQTLLGRSLVTRIRLECGRAFDMPPETDFFHLNYLPGETADAALLRLFEEEHDAQVELGLDATVESVINTLIHG